MAKNREFQREFMPDFDVKICLLAWADAFTLKEIKVNEWRPFMCTDKLELNRQRPTLVVQE